jgi:hypothetical protein
MQFLLRIFLLLIAFLHFPRLVHRTTPASIWPEPLFSPRFFYRVRGRRSDVSTDDDWKAVKISSISLLD